MTVMLACKSTIRSAWPTESEASHVPWHFPKETTNSIMLVVSSISMQFGYILAPTVIFFSCLRTPNYLINGFNSANRQLFVTSGVFVRRKICLHRRLNIYTRCVWQFIWYCAHRVSIFRKQSWWTTASTIAFLRTCINVAQSMHHLTAFLLMEV